MAASPVSEVWGTAVEQKNRPPFYGMALYTAILTELAGSILAGIFSGKWLDGKAGTEPTFLIIGLLLGLTGGVWAVIYTIRQFSSGD